MKKQLFISCLCLFAALYVNAQTFTSLDASGSNKKIEWNTSNWGDGFGHKIFSYDPGGMTLLNIAARHNSASWTNVMTFTSNGLVGIGTDAPNAGLEISKNSSTEAKVLRLTNSSWASNMSTSLEFKTGDLKSVPTSKISSIMNGNGSAGDRLGFFVQENGVNPNNNPLVEKLSLLPNGNVGIGTTTPSSKLHVEFTGEGSIIAKANSNGSHGASNIVVDAASNFPGRFLFREAGQNKGWIDYSSGKINIRSATNNALLSVLTGNGNVGIGTTAPNAGLEISKNSSTEAKVLRLTNSSWASNMSTSLEFKTGDLKSVPTSKISSIMNGNGSAGDRLGFFVQENGVNPNNNPLVEKLSLLPNGNVGIGTTTPSSKLHVEFTGEGSIIAKANSNGSHGASNIVVDAASNFPGRFLFREAGQNKGWIDYSSGKINIKNATNNPLLSVLTDNGNVGIGTTTPDAKLAVNGKIHTKEVKVDLTGWPDFVFENNYDLPTLREVEIHIKEKGHLANIPSAEQVKKEGLFLGEMNAKLLQKIEELTLYTIEQQKEIQALKVQNNQFKEISTKLIELQNRLEKIEN